MHLPLTLLSLLSAVLASPPPSPQHILTDSSLLPNGFNIPTRNESTILARRLLARSRAGVLSTIFPSNISSPYVPHAVANTPIGLPDYIATCEDTGNPTLLALTISTSTRNAVAGSNVSLAISWWDEYTKLTGAEPWSAANLPRASLVGYLEEMTDSEIERADVVKCFTGVHGDARWWLPGDKGAAHAGVWMRMVVEEVYWIGGFGDRAFIGWFEPEVWRAVTRREWEAVRLPGEQ